MGLAGRGWCDIGLFDDRVQPSTTGLPTTRFFPVSQEASLRSDWSTKAVALWFKGKEPWLAKGYGVYSHGDVGSFILHAYGELLAVDAGYDHWVSYDLYPPELHNTLLVDGKGPVSGTPGLLENALDAGVLQAGEIRATYAGAAHRRVFLLVDGRYAVIADNIRSPKARRYDWQIHTPVSRGTGQVTLRGNRASWTGFDPRTDTPGKVRLEVGRLVWLAPMESRAGSRGVPIRRLLLRQLGAGGPARASQRALPGRCFYPHLKPSQRRRLRRWPPRAALPGAARRRNPTRSWCQKGRGPALAVWSPRRHWARRASVPAGWSGPTSAVRAAWSGMGNWCWRWRARPARWRWCLAPRKSAWQYPAPAASGWCCRRGPPDMPSSARRAPPHGRSP